MQNVLKISLITLFIIITISNAFSSESGQYEGILSSGHFLREDYKRTDLLTIAEVGSVSEVTNSWKVSSETLDRQKSFSLSKLLKEKNIGKLILMAIDFTNVAYNGFWKEQLNFISMEYLNLENNKFGTSLQAERNDWILVFNFREKNVSDDRISEKVFMTPDGTVIISDNNFEEVNANACSDLTISSKLQVKQAFGQ